MADKASYPQIPSTVWWGVRKLLQRTPNATINERTLGVELNVQEAAARQYVAELRRAGILNDEAKATPLAHKWRHDDTYGEAVSEILANAYPADLVQVAPPGSADRQKVISWFTRDGLGVGTAGNKAATYLLLGSAVPNEAPSRGSTVAQKVSAKERPAAAKKTTAAPAPTTKTLQATSDSGRRTQPSEPIPLNVNVQIHISADATSEQIESIFAAMRRYLYDGTAA